MVSRKQKQSAIELLRIIGCFLVIMAHSQLYPCVDGKYQLSRLVFSTIIADDVPIFFLITGFFFFPEIENIASASARKVKKFLLNIYIPTIIFVIISCVYESFVNLQEGSTLIGNINWEVLQNFLFRMNPGNHLWYICAYAQFVFLYPMLAYICRDEENCNNIRRLLLAFSIGVAVMADCQYYICQGQIDVNKYGFGYYVIYMLLGYELFLYLKKRGGRRAENILIGLTMYFAAFIVKLLVQYRMFQKYNYTENQFRWLQCSLGFLSVSGLFLFVYSIVGGGPRAEGFKKVINWIGGKTFYIYLVHYLVIARTYDIRNTIVESCKGANTFGQVFLYYLKYTIVVFVISLLLSGLFYIVYDLGIKRIILLIIDVIGKYLKGNKNVAER